jgi:hypothetical protein
MIDNSNAEIDLELIPAMLPQIQCPMIRSYVVIRPVHKKHKFAPDMSQGCSHGYKPKTGPKRTQKEYITKKRKYKYFTPLKL